MKEIVEDWHRHCLGECEFEDSHFLGLFKANLTDEELSSVFRHFPFAEEMELRLRNVLAAGHIGNYAYLQQPELAERFRVLSAAKAWAEQQGRFCIASGEDELGSCALRASVAFVDRVTFERLEAGVMPDAEISDRILQKMWWTVPEEPRGMFALVEALYGMAANYDLAWYVVEPRLTAEIDFTKYFEFWRLGGAGVFADSAYLVRDSA